MLRYISLAFLAIVLVTSVLSLSAQIGRRFPSERKVVKDPVTGTMLTFLSSTPNGDSKIYQTHNQWTSDGEWLIFRSNRVPGEAMLPGASTLRGPLSCLNEARFGIVFGAVGAARACFEEALAYARERIVFGKPISAYQLTQQKLAEMALEVNRASLVALHIGRMKDDGTLRPEHVSLGKMGNVRGAIEVCRSARTILGGNGITLEYPVIRHMNNLESVLTYEGTHEVHTLVVGQALTGENAFR